MESKPRPYDSVADDQEELLSRTEVDDTESLMNDGKEWNSPGLESGKRSRRRTVMTVLKSYRWLIDMFLLLVIIGLLSLLLLRDPWAEPPPTQWQVGGDFTGAGPKFPLKVTKWAADMEYVPMNTSEFFTDKTLSKWQSIMPAGTRAATADETFFTTSMTHQLHCLYMMARIYSGVVSNMTKGLPDDYHFHFLHCVDYVRQAVMCTADLALEAHDVTDADDLGPLDGGWSGHHVCKDYTHITAYLEEQIVEGVRVVLPIDD